MSAYPWYQEHLNKHNVIHIMFNEMPKKCCSYDSYMERIENFLVDDLIAAYPKIKVRDSDAVWDVLKKIFEYCGGEAIDQIKDRKYVLRFEGKIGEKPEYTGRILAVGIAYNKEDKKKRHQCMVEVLRERL